MPALELSRKIAARSAQVGVIGLGYVGLPLALACSRAGFPVLGFDIDPVKVSRLARGQSYLTHVPDDAVAEVIGGRGFEATADFDRLGEPDIVVICVPTPLSPERVPDLSYVTSTVERLVSKLRAGTLVVLESTTYPGTTEELIATELRRSGLELGRDVFLGFSPEREDPGNREFETRDIPKVVGGIDEASSELAEAFYSQVVRRVVRVSSARVAEAAKLTENIFRAVNIALVNELKTVFDAMDIDVWEVLDAAETKPFGFMRFDPGPGWGGHCIPVDPFYLAWKAKGFGVDTRFIELAGEVNRRMPDYVTAKLRRALDARGVPMSQSKVLLVGLAYKRNVGDTRESPAFRLIEQLNRLGSQVSYHDPYVPVFPETRSSTLMPGELRSQPLDPESLQRFDAVVIVTDHDCIDYQLLERHARLIVDARGRYRGKRDTIVPA